MTRFSLAFETARLKIPFLIGEWSVKAVWLADTSGVHVDVLAFVYAELVRIDSVKRRDVGMLERGGS
jgi:hypothetical protein